MTTNHSDFVDILSHDRPRSCRPSAINIKEPISKLTWHAIAMALWNSGTMEQKWPRSNTVLKKRNERTLRWRDPATYLPGYPRQARQVLLALNEVLHLIRVHFRETRKVVRRGGLDILFPVTGNEDFRPKEPVENAWMKSWSWPIFVVGCQKKRSDT